VTEPPLFHGPKNHDPFPLPGPARPVNAHYKQFVSLFLENLFLAKTSKLEIIAVNVSAVVIKYDDLLLTYVLIQGLAWAGKQ